MKIKNLTISVIRTAVAASCLALVLGIQAFAEPQLQQPNSVGSEGVPAAEATVAQDEEITPAGCTDSCCGDSCCGDGCCGNGSCCGGNCCCDAVCCPKKVTEEVKKHCWKVKPELVCIPGFTFKCNWRLNKCQRGGCGNDCCGDTCCGDSCCADGCCGNGSCCGCPPKCGRVRCINVLEKHDYTCDKCGYEWEVKCVRSGNGGCSRGKGGCCCPSCGCASVEVETEDDVQLTSATETPDAEAVTEKSSLARRLMPWLK